MATVQGSRLYGTTADLTGGTVRSSYSCLYTDPESVSTSRRSCWTSPRIRHCVKPNE